MDGFTFFVLCLVNFLVYAERFNTAGLLENFLSISTKIKSILFIFQDLLKLKVDKSTFEITEIYFPFGFVLFAFPVGYCGDRFSRR